MRRGEDIDMVSIGSRRIAWEMEKPMERRKLLRLTNQTRMLAIASGFVLLGAQMLVSSPALSASPAPQVHLRLVDRLDRPDDGYCLDIPGTQNMRVELPLFAHNCKTSLTSDSAVVFSPDGFIQFPAVDLCITAAGVNAAALPGSSILLRKCNASSPIFDISRLQRFTHRNDGSLTLVGSELCLTVGTQSAATLSPFNRWRALFVDNCATAKPARSRWEFIVPGR